MVASVNPIDTKPDANINVADNKHALHADFLALLPTVQAQACFQFRHLACPDRRADSVAECVALAWMWYLRLRRRGRDVSEFAAAFATLLARAVRSGRRLCGHERANDVTSPVAQRRHNFKVEALPCSTATSYEQLYGAVHGQRDHDVLEERLADNTRTPPDQQAMFRIDFAAWMRTLTARQRRLVRRMMTNERTKDLAARFQVTPGRVSQLRRQLKDDWLRFCGDEATVPSEGAACAS